MKNKIYREFKVEIGAPEIPIDNIEMKDAIQIIAGWLSGDLPRQVCFVNAHCVNVARHDPLYYRTLHTSDLLLADGSGICLAGKLQGIPIVDNVNGTDLFPKLCEAIPGRKIYLLGAKPGVAELVSERISKNYSDISVVGTSNGYFTSEGEGALIEEIRNSGAELLLVAMGIPVQDLWIEKHLSKLGVKVAIGVGGLFEFYSGQIPRAPVWMRKRGIEWMYRLIQEPRRMWQRYLLGNFLFVSHILKQNMLGSAASASEMNSDFPIPRKIACIFEAANEDEIEGQDFGKISQFLSESGIESLLLYNPEYPSSISFLQSFDQAYPIVELSTQLAELSPDQIWVCQLGNRRLFQELVRSGILLFGCFSELLDSTGT